MRKIARSCGMLLLAALVPLACSDSNDGDGPSGSSADQPNATGFPDLVVSRDFLRLRFEKVAAGDAFMVRRSNKKDCAVVEGMIDTAFLTDRTFTPDFNGASGTRFLMRFDSMTPNVGNNMLE